MQLFYFAFWKKIFDVSFVHLASPQDFHKSDVDFSENSKNNYCVIPISGLAIYRVRFIGSSSLTKKISIFQL